MRLAVLLVVLFAAVFCIGCGGATRWTPHRLAPLPASASLAPPPNPDVPHRIDILESPRQLRTDAVYPPMAARHRIMWDGDGLDWRMRFPPRRYAYASFTLRRPIDLAAHYPRMRLVFNIRPARSVNFLSVGLVDRPPTGVPALSDVELLNRAPPLGDGWTRVSIPLGDFPHGAPVKSSGSAAAPTASPTGSAPRPLDWSRIQEIRIISPGGEIPAEEIAIRDIRFQRL
jgi:hypothetical protein